MCYDEKLFKGSEKKEKDKKIENISVREIWYCDISNIYVQYFRLLKAKRKLQPLDKIKSSRIYYLNHFRKIYLFI